MGAALIECVDAEVRYRNALALGPLSMRIESGDFWGVVGPNGAGKSTLLRLLSGQVRVDRGEIFRTKVDVGFLLQHHDYTKDLPFRVKDVVGFGVLSAGSLGFGLGADEKLRVVNALQHLGLEQMRDKLYRELSGGERQKVQFARLIAQDSDLSLLDEPTAGLDLDWQERVTHLAAQFHDADAKTIVMVTHDVDRLPECCGKVLLLKNGRVLAAGKPADVFNRSTLSELYDCKMEVAERAGRYHAFSC